MNHSALTRTLEAARPAWLILRLPPCAAPRRLLYGLWLRIFGPPAIDPRVDTQTLGAFRAFSEVGSDYLPSSGTWPSSRAFTSDRS